jgi:5'/3'-nucleotidase
MRILISNDDGITAPGLAALRDAIADVGEVSVVAPATHQSAAGHAITLKRPLAVERVALPCAGEAFGLSVDGSPADCVRLAIRRLLDDPPQLVLSGINAGANVGHNVFYSGTVAAAVEAAMMDIPSVAFSSELTDQPVDYPRTAQVCRSVLLRLLESGLGVGDLVNVNVPNRPIEEIRGVCVARQSRAGIEDVYNPHDVENPGESYLLADEYRFIGHTEDDVAALEEGFVTVTPLRVDMTDYDKFEGWEACHWDGLFKTT